MITSILLSEVRLKQLTVINENVDPKILTPTIRDVQEIYVHPVLGTALYNDIQTEIISDPDLSSNTDYKTLLTDYIQPFMAKAVQYECYQELNFKTTNKGVESKNGDNLSSASMNDIIALANRESSKMKIYQERLTRYLLQNAQAMFPLYLNPGSGIDIITPHTQNNKGGIYLGPSARQNSALDNYRNERRTSRQNNPYGYPTTDQ
ncbi:hypothetical protein UFOVP1015_37 [uncultured Caudovirales phage]|uniref:Uncharacterized protein n=1 Tax=uncultured Caudovirales phage TaxID=2100421 RepID=A0A6J7XEK3_9CAUD|nr:hypothetical protein UFOVP1015_37 [uncultured Caudovirales phage]CAB5229245.1 hypothetical protein UFOVP1551_18 [uncultured Caudovirales phage]